MRRRRRPAPRAVLLLILAALVAAGCSSAGKAAAPATTSTTQPPETTTTTVPPTTTTTTTTPPPPPTYPLTGRPATDAGIAGRAAVAVKIDNIVDARPQAGVIAADVVYEEFTEGVTRFIVVYHSSDAEVVGPVRSVRPADPVIVTPLGGVFGFSGGSPGAVALAARHPAHPGHGGRPGRDVPPGRAAGAPQPLHLHRRPVLPRPSRGRLSPPASPPSSPRARRSAVPAPSPSPASASSPPPT